MNLDGEGLTARGLRRYVRLVAEAVGVGYEASLLQLDEPVSVYLALDRCSATQPDDDLALLWDEHHGWALAAEDDSGADLRVLGYLGTDLLPAPCVVGRYVDQACDDGDCGQSAVPSFESSTATDLAARLTEYAERIYDGPGFADLTRPDSFDRQSAAPATMTSALT
jgi:hypothetical protein